MHIIFPVPYHKIDLKYFPQYKFAFLPFSDIARWIKTDSLTGALIFMFKRVLLFIPLGFYLPMISQKAVDLWRTYVIGLKWAIGFELIKLLISWILGVIYKHISVDFALLYSAGILIGAAVFLLLRPWVDKYIAITDYTFTIRGN